MKKLLFLIGFIAIMINVFGQSQGISYQAVIISTSAQQIPGYDIEGNYLPNHAIKVRFTILDIAGTVDYQEEQSTKTDAYGMINLTIGQDSNTTTASPHLFKEIDWDGNKKDLKVDISLDTNSAFYTDFSLQELNFIPYAYHKNITASGSLIVDGKSNLQDLTVEATTNLLGSLDVNNSSPTHLTGNLFVGDTTTLDDNLYVNATGSFKGQITIDADLNGDQGESDNYPLVIKGATQGISIKIDGSRSSANNYVLFSDDGGVQGRIEGEDAIDVLTDPKYYIENASYVAGVVKATIDVVGASTSSTVCVGLGACVTTPTPSLIIAAVAKLVVAVVQIASYNYFRFANAGVVYKTKGADYAEWLPKRNPIELFYPGEIVGIKGGYVTHDTQGADVIMVVSTNPIVLGNTPDGPDETKYVRIAFVGQVPARILGAAKPGDYLIANGLNDGGGIAVSPDQITAAQIPYIAGMVWPNSEKTPLGFANIAVGINVTNVALLDIKQEEKIKAQTEEIDQLKDQVSQMNNVLEQMFPEYAELLKNSQPSPVKTATSDSTTAKITVSQLSNSNLTMIYADITNDQILQGVELAKQMLVEQNYDVTNDPVFKRLINEPDYLNSFATEMQSNIQKHIDADYEKNMKAGVNVVKMSK